ncbi:MAG: dipeptidase [Myxococcales bacterium]
MRRALLALPLLACAHAPESPRADDLELHRRAVVVDTHSDVTQAITYEGYDFAQRHDFLHEDLPRAREGGLDAEFFSIWINPETIKAESWYAESLHQVEAVQAMARKNASAVALARTAAEVRSNAARGVFSVLLGLEGGHSLLPGTEDEQIEHLRRFGQLGVRYMTLTWSISNPIGGSSSDAGERVGLTPFGRRVIEEMDRLGMVVDVSHGSDPLFWDAIRAVKKPVIASHSSVRALANVPRNMTDSMIKAVAANGGAVCVNFFSGFLDEPHYRAVAQYLPQMKTMTVDQSQRFLRTKSLPPVSLARIADHVDHIVKVAGADHACVGSDFDGIPTIPTGMEDASKLPWLTGELRRRGYTPDQLEKILGGNVLRVLEANERGAAAPQARAERIEGWTVSDIK